MSKSETEELELHSRDITHPCPTTPGRQCRAYKNVDSTDTELRYAAYGARLRTALRATQRYVAYVLSFFPCLHHYQR